MERKRAMAINVPKPPYPAPPIVEAVIQIRFADRLAKSAAAKTLKKLRVQYAHVVDGEVVGINVNLDNRTTDFTPNPRTRLASDDQADVLVIEPNALTWSRLAPYCGWNSLIQRVKRDFQLVHTASGYRKVERLGVRYVNRVDVPLSDDSVSYYEEYIDAHIRLPEFLEPTDGYGWRVEKHFIQEGMLAIIQSASGDPVIPGTGPFIFDIDVISKTEIPAKADDMFAKLEKMRDLKNKIFELSMTDKARMSFQ
jgi:uncharacterized protein (TIGR04255 family)